MNQLEVARIKLKQAFQERKAKNSHYSLRAFSRSLEVSASTLSEFFSQKKDLSSILLDRLMAQIQSPDEHAEFLGLPYKDKPEYVKLNQLSDIKAFLEARGSEKSYIFKLGSDSEFYVCGDSSLGEEIESLRSDFLEKISAIAAKAKCPDVIYKLRLSSRGIALLETTPVKSPHTPEPQATL